MGVDVRGWAARVTITEAELAAMRVRYGGIRNLAVESTYQGGELHPALVTSPARPPLN